MFACFYFKLYSVPSESEYLGVGHRNLHFIILPPRFGDCFLDIQPSPYCFPFYPTHILPIIIILLALLSILESVESAHFLQIFVTCSRIHSYRGKSINFTRIMVEREKNDLVESGLDFLNFWLKWFCFPLQVTVFYDNI